MSQNLSSAAVVIGALRVKYFGLQNVPEKKVEGAELILTLALPEHTMIHGFTKGSNSRGTELYSP